MALAAPSARGALGMSVTSDGMWQAGPETRPDHVLLAPGGLPLALAVGAMRRRGRTSAARLEWAPGMGQVD